MQKTVKNLSLQLLVLLMGLLTGADLYAQQSSTIRGTVKDETGEFIIGASVAVKGTTIGTVTNIDGEFSLTVSPSKPNLEIEVSYIGFKTQLLKVTDNAPINVVLVEDVQALEELVVVGYGTQKRLTMSSAVASVKGEKLAGLPAPRLSSSLGGMVSGIITFQGSGAPGSDGANIYLRGKTPMILIDGVERGTSDRLNKDDIESVSVLKDAAAVAPYGMAGANGVILVTTKRGSDKPAITYNGEMSWQKPMNTPSFMGSADYYDFLNKANEMAGLNPVKTADEIALYRSGENPDRYPNTDWAGNYMGTSPATKHNISVAAGSDKIKAFVSLGYVYQGSMFDGQDYSRYTARANVDIQATPTTKISFDNSFMKDIITRDGLGADQIMERIYSAVPYEVDRFSNGLSAFQPSMSISLYEALHHREEYKEQNDISNTNFTINQQLPFLKGLSAKVAFNYDKQHKDLKNWIQPVTYYNLASDDTFEKIDQSTTIKPSLSHEYKRWDWYTFNASLNYKNTFDKHSFDALALFEARWMESSVLTAGRSEFFFPIQELSFGTPDKEKWSMGGNSAQTAQAGGVGRINYNYDQRYLLELAGRYDATYYYAPGKRTDFFPSASLGWRISEEPFMDFARNSVDNLKLRASYGKSGAIDGNEFYYMSLYNVGNSYVWGKGEDAVRQQGIFASLEPNPDLTWQSVWKTNIGFDLSMWNGLLGVEFDWWHEKRNDIVINPIADVNPEYGIGLAQENSGIDARNGVDITLTNQTKIAKDFKLSNTVVFSYAHQKWIEKHENQGTLYNPRKRQTGYPDGQIWGYKSAGLFKDEADIQNWAWQDAGTLPGDIKYVDLNGDGKIDGEDITHIGLARVPEIMFGYNLRATWKDFDLGIFIQGTGRSNFYLGSSDRGVRRPFAFNKARTEHANAWTTDNPDPNAAYPRLRPDNFAKNYETSDFWVINSSYIKLKSIDLGYNLKPVWIKKAGLKNLRIYGSFYNLWTIFSKASKDFDPESQQYSAYPQQFVSTIGLTATF
jgi:TonB-linked SusC/RagA family outer membrane protein